MERMKLFVSPTKPIGHLVFLIGPAGIGKSTYTMASDADGIALMKGDVYEYIMDGTAEIDVLDSYEVQAMAGTILALFFAEEVARRRRSTKRCERIFVVELCALTKTAQAQVFALGQYWVDHGGTAQVVVAWPGKSPTPDPEGFLRYLTRKLAENPDDENTAIALPMWKDFHNSGDHPRFRLPYKNPLLDSGSVFGAIRPLYQDWWKDDPAAEPDQE
jgi:hypothetical protein